jgi:hypothetical protein
MHSSEKPRPLFAANIMHSALPSVVFVIGVQLDVARQLVQRSPSAAAHSAIEP